MLSRRVSVGLWSACRRSLIHSPEPFHPLPGRTPNWLSPSEAIKCVTSNNRIFVHGVAATPTPLLEALTDHCRSEQLKNIRLYHLHLMGNVPWADPELDGIMRSECFHICDNLRTAVNEGRADHTSIFFSEIPLMFKRGIVPLDVALIHVSVPDRQGFCSLGTNVDCTRAALTVAKHIIGVCNPKMPRTFGDGIIHESHFDALCHCDFPLPEVSYDEPTEQQETIGKLIADNLVTDGATVQLGIGSTSKTVAPFLNEHKDLGVHTEMLTDSIIDLIDNNNVTNSRKTVFPGKVVATMCTGSSRLYDYVDDNPLFMLCDVAYNNDIRVIRQNPRVTSVNTAIEVDISGQVCADSIGENLYSGVGGQIDFVRGATLCHDGQGKAIICLTSTTERGESKIVPFLKHGAGVVTTRADVNYVVTEYGIAQLHGKNQRQRAYELIQIAHPDHREQLEKEGFERFKTIPSPQ